MEFHFILKKINNTLTTEEKEIFDAWYRESEEHSRYFIRVQQKYLKGLDIIDFEKAWNGLSSKITKKKKRYTYFKYAAAITIPFAVGYLWLSPTEITIEHVPEQSVFVKENKIEVGSDKATLTLEDGSKVALEKGANYETDKVSSNGEQLVYKDKSKTSKKAFAKNILTIPRGGQFFLVLADGTKVWMNSETQLKYPVGFMADETREVELIYGEAYFEVSPSIAHNGASFIVVTEGQKVAVLGTEFNIKAYSGDGFISTTLVEGKVQVKNENIFKNLVPGEQSRLNKNANQFDVSKVDVYDAVSWKIGLFSFKNQSLEEIMKVLSRWYDVDVVFQNEAIKNMKFNGILRKSQHLDEILNIIENTNEVSHEINQKTITMK